VRLELRQIRGVASIYTDKHGGHDMPEHLSRLAPDAAASFEADLKPHVVVSDMWRSAASSLLAVKEGRGAALPGYSAHNFGLAIDIDVARIIREYPGMFANKRDLDEWMAAQGWFCWRDDHKLERESWHYYYFGKGAKVQYFGGNCVGYWNAYALRRHGADFNVSDIDAQRMLVSMKLYHGPVDGKVGPLTKEAIGTFQRAYSLPLTLGLDPRTQRTLAFVAAAIVVL